MVEGDKERALANSLAEAKTALELDKASHTEAAIEAYNGACSIIQQAIDRSCNCEERKRLQSFQNGYATRIEELQQLEDSQYVLVDAEPQEDSGSIQLRINDQIIPTNPAPWLEKAGILPMWNSHSDPRPLHLRRRQKLCSLLLILSVLLLWNFGGDLVPWARTRTIDQGSHMGEPRHCLPLKDVPPHLKPFQDCSIRRIWSDTKRDFMRTARPLGVSEFVTRRNRLAEALVADGFDAFVVEPGYTFKYYADVSQPDWEVWEPEERPFLMVVRPAKADGEVVANTTFLVPSFEEERAQLLDMPFEDEIETVTYEEHWDPYSTLLDSPVFSSFTERNPKIMVDEEMRDFISRGLAKNGFDVVGLGDEVERVRQIKSEAEIGILRAVNTGTVEAVKAMRKCLTPDVTENEVMQVLDNTMLAVGLRPFFDIVLFDEDASNPHGGTDGSKRLENDTMVLIDVGAHLYGYSSDICRSFFPPFLEQPRTKEDYAKLSDEMRKKLKVWDIVFLAQAASLDALHENSSAAAVDIAARKVITDAGYGEAFTHRVGHGIGIKAHESPYLNKGNVNTTLKAGMTFTSEPGIYLGDKFGVRHEDVLLVKEDGLPDVLTGRRARGPWEP